MIRPKEDSTAIFYGARCVELNLPYFTLEIQCINETDEYFGEFVHELGLLLRSTACLSSVRRMRHGHLTLLDHGLLRKHWTLEHILNNIQLCKSLIVDRLLKPGQTLGSDKLITTGNAKYLDTVQSDFDCVEEEIDSERLLIEDRGLLEERLPSNTKTTVPILRPNYD